MSSEEFRLCMRSQPPEKLLDSVQSWFGPDWPYGTNNSILEFLVQGYEPSFFSGGSTPMASRDDFPLAAPVVMWAPVMDGTVDGIPEIPLQAIQQGRHNKVPMISATVRVSTWNK